VGEAAVAGDAGLVVDQGQLAAGQTVEQRGLADIGSADDGELSKAWAVISRFREQKRQTPDW
jgi:hypothetical protein